MEYGHLSRYGLFALIISATLWTGCKSVESAARPKYAGDTLHLQASGIRTRKLGLLWILRAEDCLTCFTPSVLLRQAQRRLGPSVGITLAVVKGDSQEVAAYADRERLNTDIVVVRAASNLGEIAKEAPILVALQDSVIAGSWNEGELATLSTDSIMAAVRRLQANSH